MTKHKHTHTINSNKNSNKIHIVINEKKTKRRKRNNKKTHPKTHPTIIQSYSQPPIIQQLPPPRQYDYAGFASNYNGGNPDARGQPIAIRHGNDLLSSIHPPSVPSSHIHHPQSMPSPQMHPSSPSRVAIRHDNDLLHNLHPPSMPLPRIPRPSPYSPHKLRSHSPPPNRPHIIGTPQVAPAKIESDNQLLQSVNLEAARARALSPDRPRVFTRPRVIKRDISDAVVTPQVAPAKMESDNPLLQSVNLQVTSARPLLMIGDSDSDDNRLIPSKWIGSHRVERKLDHDSDSDDNRSIPSKWVGGIAVERKPDHDSDSDDNRPIPSKWVGGERKPDHDNELLHDLNLEPQQQEIAHSEPQQKKPNLDDLNDLEFENEFLKLTEREQDELWSNMDSKMKKRFSKELIEKMDDRMGKYEIDIKRDIKMDIKRLIDNFSTLSEEEQDEKWAELDPRIQEMFPKKMQKRLNDRFYYNHFLNNEENDVYNEVKTTFIKAGGTVNAIMRADLLRRINDMYLKYIKNAGIKGGNNTLATKLAKLEQARSIFEGMNTKLPAKK
jgi:hypothetical protein